MAIGFNTKEDDGTTARIVPSRREWLIGAGLLGLAVLAVAKYRSPADITIKTSLDEEEKAKFGKIYAAFDVTTDDEAVRRVIKFTRKFPGGAHTGLSINYLNTIDEFKRLDVLERAVLIDLQSESNKEPLVGKTMIGHIVAGNREGIAAEIVEGCNGLRKDDRHIENIRRAAAFLKNPDYVITKKAFLSTLKHQIDRKIEGGSKDDEIVVDVTAMPEGLTADDIRKSCGTTHTIKIRDLETDKEIVSEKATPGKTVIGAFLDRFVKREHSVA